MHIRRGLVWLLFAPFLAWWGTAAALALRAVLPIRRRDDPTRKRFDVVIPAHDEEAGVGDLVRALKKQASIGTVLVVADHCNDATADVARGAGAEVLERLDGAAGKPPSLAAGVSMLAARADRGDAVVLLDGDCMVNDDFADALSRRLGPDDDVVQAAYTLDEPSDDDVRANLKLGFSLRNVVRPRGADALGIPVLLVGSGMLFRWRALEHLSFGDPRIAGTADSRPVADDTLMALDLLAAGVHPRFAEEARVWAPTPDDEHALGAQRLRWEGGQALMWRRLPSVAGALVRRRDARGLVALVDWTVPALSASVLAAGVTGAATVAVAPAAPATAFGALAAYLGIGVAALEGPSGVARLVVRAPRFIAWKTSLYRRHRVARRTA